MTKHSVKISTDTIVSLSAIIIALASIVVTTWQGIETRKHNRLSVRPRLEIIFESGKNSFGYVLMNNGLGPAIITGKKIFVDGKEINYTGFSGYDEFIDKLGLNDRDLSHSGIYSGKTIRASERKNIFRIYLNERDDLKKLLPKIYSRVRIEISYKSMYNEPFICKIPK
ncbi:MAG: hypothetical protein GXO77_07030 [Calditrichaeota bacterium]|nr:hypothetical protein [Calditrichota bacterium]